MSVLNIFTNRNQQLVAENEIERITQAVIAGRLNERINTLGFSSENQHIGNSINKILDAIVITAMAFFLTAMWLNTMVLTPLAIAW